MRVFPLLTHGLRSWFGSVLYTYTDHHHHHHNDDDLYFTCKISRVARIGSGCIVNVFPLPVCPYANTVDLPWWNKVFTRGNTVARYTYRCSGVGGWVVVSE